jgi:hypothetical protein
MNEMKHILCLNYLGSLEQTVSLEYREYTFICIALFEFPDSKNISVNNFFKRY